MILCILVSAQLTIMHLALSTSHAGLAVLMLRKADVALIFMLNDWIIA